MNKKQEFGAVTEEDFEQTFEQTPEIEISSIKELRESLLNINNKLHADDWQHRVDNLRILRGIIKANRFPTDDFLQNIKFLDLEIKNCVSDLRSQVVREACITVAFLSKEIKNKLDYFLEQIIESLMNLVSNGVKIMSTSGKVALKYIVYNTNSVRILPFFLTTISTSKSTSLRQFCSELLKLICENWNMKYLEKSSSNIAEAIKKGISDADEQTRAQSREAFCWFNGKFPKLGDKLLQSLDPTKQKALQKELLSFKGDEIDSADVFKVPITNAVKTTVKSVTSKPSNFTGRTRVNSAKSENPSAKPKTATARIDTSDPRGRIQKVSQSQPSTRDPSPSCKSGYITYSNGASDYKYTNNFQKKASPNTYSSLRYKDAFETQVAEASNPSVNIDHSECSKSIDELKQQICILKNENSQLDCELHSISLELTNWKSLNDKLQSDKSSLESTNEELKTQNQNLKENFQILSAEFVSERDQWLIEKQQLEKQLSEIRRELENKIIEIRQKHSDQVLGFEEKIRLLKNQLSDTLKMRSVERQFEIDRISKDLEKSQINEENLRNRLNKVMEKQNSNSQSELQLCENCRKPLKSKKPNDGMAEIRKEKLDVNKLFDVNDRWKPGAARSAENKH